jgi:hypothetical protein
MTYGVHSSNQFYNGADLYDFFQKTVTFQGSLSYGMVQMADNTVTPSSTCSQSERPHRGTLMRKHDIYITTDMLQMIWSSRGNCMQVRQWYMSMHGEHLTFQRLSPLHYQGFMWQVTPLPSVALRCLQQGYRLPSKLFIVITQPACSDLGCDERLALPSILSRRLQSERSPPTIGLCSLFSQRQCCDNLCDTNTVWLPHHSETSVTDTTLTQHTAHSTQRPVTTVPSRSPYSIYQTCFLGANSNRLGPPFTWKLLVRGQHRFCLNMIKLLKAYTSEMNKIIHIYIYIWQKAHCTEYFFEMNFPVLQIYYMVSSSDVSNCCSQRSEHISTWNSPGQQTQKCSRQESKCTWSLR